MFSPQQTSAPSAPITHTWLLSVTICVAALGKATLNGTRLCPSPAWPSWPMSSAPKQCAVPSLRSAQLWLAPVATRAQSPSTPTRVGRLREVVSPRPNWPRELSPQQYKTPCSVAQEWPTPESRLEVISVPVAALVSASASGVSPDASGRVAELSVSTSETREQPVTSSHARQASHAEERLKIPLPSRCWHRSRSPKRRSRRVR